MGNLACRSWTLSLALAVGAAAAVVPSRALASEVSCGDTISANTTLQRDLVDCPGDGLVIGADKVRLNLNGHTIDGDGVPSDCPDEGTCDVGVDNHAGHDEVAILDGTVREFGVGVLASGGVAQNRLQGLSVSHNSDFGIRIEDSTGVVVASDSLTDNGISGLLMIGSRRALVSEDSISGSGGYAIPLFEVDDSTIQDNTLDGNDHGILADGSSRNIIRRNSVFHGGGSSIDIGGGAAHNRVERNRLSDNGDGIILTEADNNLISRNTVTGTGFFGFPDTGGFGILLDGANRNSVERNVVTGGRGPAIFVTSLDAPTASAHDFVSRNVANSKLSDGIRVDAGATDTVLELNAADRSGDDGIDVAAPGSIIARNVANRNHDLGVEAVPGVIDGGGNRARENQNPLQCTNIACG